MISDHANSMAIIFYCYYFQINKTHAEIATDTGSPGIRYRWRTRSNCEGSDGVEGKLEISDLWSLGPWSFWSARYLPTTKYTTERRNCDWLSRYMRISILQMKMRTHSPWIPSAGWSCYRRAEPPEAWSPGGCGLGWGPEYTVRYGSLGIQ